MSKYYLGIDCGGTNIRIGIVDSQYKIHKEEKYASSQVGANLSNLIKTYILKHQSDYLIEAIGIGFPGIVDQTTRSVLNIPNQRAFEGDYLLDLEKALGLPIVVGNDVNLLMLYDAKHFKIDSNKSVMGFYLGTGLGSAIRIKDQMYQGDFGAAGEIGHVPVYQRGILYEAEQVDLESEVSGFKLIDIHQKYFSQTAFDEVLVKHFNDKPIQDYLHLLAIYITTQMTILDISTIILGGGVIMSKQFPKKFVEELIKKNLYTEKAKENFKVYYAPEDVNSGILGAVIYARSYLNI